MEKKEWVKGGRRNGLVHVSTRTKKKKKKRGSYNGQHKSMDCAT